MNRRQFVLGYAALASLKPGQIQEAGRMPPWSPGELDIHHVNTGRGNATFLLCPDGTTMLIDCGASNDGLDVSAPPQPNASRRPGEWVARYALHHASAAARDTLDFLIATHIHPDHVGDVPADYSGGVFATGLSQVDQFMPAKVIIDRSYPDYGALPPPTAPFAANYLAWLESCKRAGRTVKAAEIGSNRQIRLRNSSSYQNFEARVLAANGRVWNGGGDSSRSLFPNLVSLASQNKPSENSCSIALRISYGRFSYYTGGDVTAETRDGQLSWLDVETPIAQACGRVEVAAANHHAYYDSCGPAFVKALDARVYVIPAWHVTHPGQAQLERLIGAWAGEKPRDVFLTNMLPGNRLFNSRWISKIRSPQGHITIRVSPGGSTYRVYVTNSTRENGPLTLTCGPYTCRQ